MPFHKVKSDLADKLNEITSVWNVGYKHRTEAHSKGLLKWTDPNLTVEEMGIKPGGKKAIIIQKMLDFNRSNTTDIIQPKIILNNDMNWQEKPKLEFYIDFEIVNNIFDDLSQIPQVGSETFVFMIGLVAVYNKNRIRFMSESQSKFYCFVAEDLSDEAEYKIFDDLHMKIKEICNEAGVSHDSVNFYHWGHIERTTYERILEKHKFPDNWFGRIINFCDFLEVFKSEPILVKNVLKFGLKSIGKGFIEHGLINIAGWDTGCSDGLEAMVQSEKCYRKLKNKRLLNLDYSIMNFKEIREIVKYNEVDCRMIFEIIKYLRKNHTRRGSLFERLTNFFFKS
jgi:hypothetical protein